MLVTCNHEFDEKLRAGFIGCGGHAFRNVYPVFQYAPVDLIAVCDVIRAKAEEFRRTFGAQQAYSDHCEMIEKEDLDAVFVVTNYDEHGRARYPQLASDCLRIALKEAGRQGPGSCVHPPDSRSSRRASNTRSARLPGRISRTRSGSSSSILNVSAPKASNSASAVLPPTPE